MSSLKTVQANSRQNVVNWETSKAFADAVKQLEQENAFVVRGEEAKKRVVKIVDGFVVKLLHGEKDKARTALCRRAGITYRTFQRWKAEGEQRAEIGDSVYRVAEKLGYDITPSSIRSLADAKRLNPGKPPEEIVRKAQCANNDSASRTVERTPLDTRESLVQALNEHLETTHGDIESVLKVLRNSPIPREQLCKMCKDKESTDGK
jgi:hypothetical protein